MNNFKIVVFFQEEDRVEEERKVEKERREKEERMEKEIERLKHEVDDAKSEVHCDAIRLEQFKKDTFHEPTTHEPRVKTSSGQ